jgi:hypothetical protein
MESNTKTEISNSLGEKKETRLVDVEVTDQQVGLQLIATFLNLAQKRGAFSIDESAKIWECLKKFQ